VWPRASSSCTRLAPTNPDAPVTKQFIVQFTQCERARIVEKLSCDLQNNSGLVSWRAVKTPVCNCLKAAVTLVHG
jgi:hypothetical protein